MGSWSLALTTSCLFPLYTQAYHVRYASMSVVDLNLPGPVLRTVSDDEFRDFYRKRYGNATWELTYGRNVSVLVAKNRAVLARCGLDTSDSFVVELATHEPITDWFGVVYRELLPQGVTVKNSTTPPHAAARSTQPDDMPLYAESIEDAKLAVCGPDKTCEYVTRNVGGCGHVFFGSA